uniref:NADH-ubiquinone oxidoreductase chain 4L n=1 Tax=Tachaea chinensis TaxID=1862870 RepID=A0A7L4XQ50_9CRUS|nr:NADH dehydrogenase subunit 4L [Tachaea chinensis]ATO58517.1 NADH dehydrogenase subunit 4L [Tachaea chinensis]QGT15736.1 NADH dehydrogenase subunit 4L [Tachaea chinensis]
MMIINESVVVGLFIFFFGLFIFMMNYNHVLISLMSLEVISLSFFLFLSVMMMDMVYNCISVIFISMAVCEGSLGLSILVVYGLVKGLEKMDIFSFLSW